MLEELLRGSLDHCVKCTICETACPVSNVTPLFGGTEVHRAAGRALPRGRRALGRDVGRLLLGLRDLHAGLPAGREDRRDQRPGAQQAQAPEGRAAARPHHHAPDVARARGDAGGEDRQLDDRQAPAADPRREAAEGPPRRAGARLRRAALLALGAQAREPASTGRKVVYFHGCGTEYYEPRGGREARRHPRAQRLRGRGPQAGLLRAAAAVQRPVRRRAQGRAAPGAQPGAARARRRTRSSSATRRAAR